MDEIPACRRRCPMHMASGDCGYLISAELSNRQEEAPVGEPCIHPEYFNPDLVNDEIPANPSIFVRALLYLFHGPNTQI